MPRKAVGDRPLTGAERQALQRAKEKERLEYVTDMLRAITTSHYLREAKEIADRALQMLRRNGPLA